MKQSFQHRIYRHKTNDRNDKAENRHREGRKSHESDVFQPERGDGFTVMELNDEGDENDQIRTDISQIDE